MTNIRAHIYADYMYGLVKRVIDEIGPRPSCSEQEKKLGRLLVEEWRPICDRVDMETFTCSPHAYLGFIPFLVLFYIAAVVLYWFFPPVSLALAVIMSSVMYFEPTCHELVDFLFPRRQGENIVGVIQPSGESKRRVVVSAHQDSAYEWNLLYYLKTAMFVVIAIVILAVLVLLGGSLAKTVAYSFGSADAPVFSVIGWVMVALSPVLGLLALFHTYRPVPGAVDDMSGVSVVAGLGRYLDDAKRSGYWIPESTEVVLLATSSEEAGIRGAKRYVKKHLEEMKATPTYGLFVENTCDEGFLAVFRRDFMTLAKHDPELIQMAQDVAASHNWPIAVMPLGILMDGSAFIAEGIPSICLSSQDVSRFLLTYHNRNDTYEYIQPESLSVMLQLVIDMIERIDKM